MDKKARLAGADFVVKPTLIANRMLFTSITQPVMYNAIYAVLTGRNMAQLDEIKVAYHQKLLTKKLEDIPFKEHKLLFIGIQAGINGEFIFNPPLTLHLQEEDILLLMGRRVSIEHFKSLYKEVSYAN